MNAPREVLPVVLRRAASSGEDKARSGEGAKHWSVLLRGLLASAKILPNQKIVGSGLF